MSKFRLWFMWNIALPFLQEGSKREYRKLLEKQSDLHIKLRKVEKRLKTNVEEYKELDRYEGLLEKFKEDYK